MQNPLFEDFLDMDLLGPSAESSDLFSYFLNPTENGEMDLTDSAAAHVDSPTMSNASMSSPLDMALPIKFEEDDEAESRKLMLMDIDSCSSDMAMLKSEQEESAMGGITQSSNVLAVDFGGDALCLTTQVMDPTHLTIKRETTVNPSATLATIAPAATTISTSAAAATSMNKKAVTVDASKSASTIPSKRASPEPAGIKKRFSPEPTTSTRKHAKTESVSSKAKASTSRKASVSVTASMSSSSISSSSSTTASTSATTTSMVDKASADALTSTANTTLSAATLQFLLQQQMQTPLIPQLFTGTLTREEIDATLARLLESTKHLIQTPDDIDQTKIKEEAASDDESDADLDLTETDGAEQTHGLKTQPGIKTDDIPSSTDLKKMTSKERRQLRNKISARNFRVRRKEYIYTLEGQVLQHKTEARHLREAVTLVQEENQRLKDELEQVKFQLTQATISGGSVTNAAPAPLSKENQTLLSAIMNRNVTSALNPNAKSNLTLSMARPQSPILTPNYHKDVPNSTSGTASSTAWKEKNPTMVHTTLVPEICFDNEFQFGQKPAQSMDDRTLNRPWLNMYEARDSTTTLTPSNPFWVSGLAFEVMTTFTAMSLSMDLAMSKTTEEQQETYTSGMDLESALDWELQQNMWAVTENRGNRQDVDVEEDKEVQLLYNLAVTPRSPLLDESAPSSTRPMSTSALQEDPNMLEWLYESMMARLVDLDLRSTQDHAYKPLSDPHSA
ncbi:hypothetical protein BGZ93_008294 [Podila epicladia]|nr:hypothetical protein BGZ92_001375 [Podila epicladia]KAG0092490.1 hypothetical protein BGZ93_008294 [Podila epicladia]